MIAAVSESYRALVFSSLAIGAIYLTLVAVRGGDQKLLSTEVLIRVPFFFIVAVFHGYFAQLVRVERKEKAVVRKKLNVARQLRRYSDSLAGTLNRSQLLILLTEQIGELLGAEFTAVFSRGRRSTIAENPLNRLRMPAESFIDHLERLIIERDLTPLDIEAKPSVLDSQATTVAPATWLQFGKFTFMPLTGAIESDLYLVVSGTFDSELLEYSRVLLQSAAMALSNSGQYQALVHEAEKRKELVTQLGQALEFKSQFVANISHELRTPIYSLLGFAELLHDGGYGAVSQEQNEALTRIIENGNSVLELINQILDLAKLDAKELKPRPSSGQYSSFVNDIADNCLPLLRSKPVAMHINGPGEVPLILLDWGLFRQIALNLVSNAVKFTEKGRIEINAGWVRDQDDPHRGILSFTVSDTGIGIRPEQFSEIFEPFRQLDNAYTKRYAGTGLGLAITKKQVVALGGTVTVQSEYGRGSTFSVSLPVEIRECTANLPRDYGANLSR
jgi:signal transduction histidine kinase